MGEIPCMENCVVSILNFRCHIFPAINIRPWPHPNHIPSIRKMFSAIVAAQKDRLDGQIDLRWSERRESKDYKFTKE